MKKLIIPALLLIAGSASAQITFGIRGNALFSAGSANWTEFNQVLKNQKEKTGFNVGLSSTIHLAKSAWFIMPEIYYTHFENKVAYVSSVDSPSVPESLEISTKTNRIDVPVMVGYSPIQPLGIFVGPVFSNQIKKDSNFEDVRRISTKDFTVGYQFGANLTISKLVLNARYEGPISKDTQKFVSNVSSQEIKYDNRSGNFLLGIGFNFN